MGTFDDPYSGPMPKVDGSVCFTHEQTMAPLHYPRRSPATRPVTYTPAETLRRQGTPLLTRDSGSSSGSSLFAPTPTPPPRNLYGQWMLPAEDAQDGNSNSMPSDRAWSSSQSLHSYRALAPKIQDSSLAVTSGLWHEEGQGGSNTAATISSGRDQKPGLYSSRALAQTVGGTGIVAEIVSQQPLLHDQPTLAGKQTLAQFRDATKPATILTDSTVPKTIPVATRDDFAGGSGNLPGNNCVASIGSPRSDLNADPANDFDFLLDKDILHRPATASIDHDRSGNIEPLLTSSMTSMPTLQGFGPISTNRQSRRPSDPHSSHSAPTAFASMLSLQDVEADDMVPGERNEPWMGIGALAAPTIQRKHNLEASPLNGALLSTNGTDIAMPHWPNDDTFFPGHMQTQPWTYQNQFDPSTFSAFSADNNNAFSFDSQPFDLLASSDFDTPFHAAPLPAPPVDPYHNTLSHVSTGTGPTTLLDSDEHGRRDTRRDDELLSLRAQNVSYREIKEKHGFKEAESTLRGRYRTLTKNKDDRVRKPAWKPEDVQILVAAVHSYAQANDLPDKVTWVDGMGFLSDDSAVGKIAWKKVAEMMAGMGCYHYGNATVKKKYVQLRQEMLQGGSGGGGGGGGG